VEVRGEVGADDEGDVGDAVEPEEDRARGRFAAASEHNALSVVHEELLESLHRVAIAVAGRDWPLRTAGVASGIKPAGAEHDHLVIYSLGHVTDGAWAPGLLSVHLARDRPRAG
jgi:hypothetical protein